MRQDMRRRLAYGSNATLVTIMVLAVLAGIYILIDSARVQVDWSAEGSNTLDPELRAKLRLIDAEGEPVVITAFTAQAGTDEAYFKDRSVRDLLRLMGETSQVLDWQQVDFDRERLTAERLGVTDHGRIVLQRGDDRVDIKERELFLRRGKGQDKSLEFVGEDVLSRGLSQLLTPVRRVVYVTSGSGELDPMSTAPAGLATLVSALDEERFDVEPLDLLRTDQEGRLPQVPDDAAVVFIARPTVPLAPPIEDVLLTYLGRGGALLVASDAGLPAPALRGRMGVSIPEGVALDRVFMPPHRDRPVPAFAPHPITQELAEARLTTVLSYPAAVRMQDPPPEGIRAEKVLVGGRLGWIDRGGPLVDGGAGYQPEIDVAGPVDYAVALDLAPGAGIVRASKPRGRVLVFGDADLFTNALVAEAPGNQVLAVNAIQWLAGADARLRAGGGRRTSVRRLAITQEQTTTLRALSLGLMPLLVLGVGIAVYVSRRGR